MPADDAARDAAPANAQADAQAAAQATAQAAAHAAAQRTARRSYGRLVALLASRTRDVAGAEDALAEAFEAALLHWPADGVPANPEAWLLTTARRRLIDRVRQRQRAEAAEPELTLLAELDVVCGPAEAPAALPDRRLELMFACAHPAIAPEARAPLMLQTVLGLDAATIAAAFLVPAATMGQRLVRAKARIRQTGIRLQVPEPDQLPERLDAVLAALYAAFAAGWSDADSCAGAQHGGPAANAALGPGPGLRQGRGLAEEAIWLAQLVSALLPTEPEALGLLSLMLHAHARRAARRDATGAYVPLAQQDTARWEHRLIDEAEALLHLAARAGRPGRYQLEAAVQSAHAARRHGGAVDAPAIERLYAALCALHDSPVARINHAVALARAQGAAAGLARLDEAGAGGALDGYQPAWAARAELLAQAGEHAQAIAAYDRALALTDDPAVQGFLQARRSALRENPAHALPPRP